MKRILIVTLAVVLLIPVLLWASFQIWLATQPTAFRASIESFTPLEFFEVVRETAFPSPAEDRAFAGRREYPGRGHSPWVMRSSLDGRPRMISLALAPQLWLAYSTETGSIHQLWRGDLDFTGPVYDARHGFEPQSRGDAYLMPPIQSAWQIESPSGWVPAKVQWRGHGFDPQSGAVWLRFELRSGVDRNSPRRVVTEWPDQVPDPTHAQVELARRFEFSEGPRVRLTVGTEPIRLDAQQGVRRVGDAIEFDRAVENAALSHSFTQPNWPVEPELPPEFANDPFAEHDCHTCHNVRERVVGPAWSEIALRYAGANRDVTARQLATRIIAGSQGRWGSVAMTPHAELSRSEARALALEILDTPPGEAPTPASPGEEIEDEATWTFGFKTEAAPETLHPSLTSTPLDTDDFTPQVGGLAWLPDGRLGVATWDPDGAVFAVAGWAGPREEIRVTRIAEGLHEPLGLAVVGDAIYVMQKQEITQLLDHDGDDWVDEYRTLSNDWRVTSNFHEFGFGLVPLDGHLYAALSVCVLKGGKSCREQTPDRGKVFRASTRTGEVEFIASGFRTPNGLAASPSGDLFVTDNQGDWLPSSKLIRIRPGADYGWRAPGEPRDLRPVTPPTLWLPQNEIGNSPTQPLFLTNGPYAGHILFGDIFNGGIKRASLEEVAGELQGAAFHFSGGLEAPVNRLLAVPADLLVDTPNPKPSRAGFIAGQIGQGGNWGELGKDRFGLEMLRFGHETAFEPLHVRALPDGFHVYFSRALASDFELTPKHFTLSDWFYVPSEVYGGPKYDLRSLEVDRVSLSSDRRMVTLRVPDLKPERVVYLRLDRAIRSEAGEALWVNEAWYTLNAIPKSLGADAHGPGRTAGNLPEVSAGGPAPGASAPINQLSEAERREGWRLLFDGVGFEGWKIYGAEDDAIEYWEIEDGALKFTRDVSFAGLLWNHLSPFSRAAVDLMTKERFGDFDLVFDWKISPGGNSGVFYLVPDERTSLAWDLGLEMQVLDDDEHMDGKIDRHRAGDLYDLQSLPTADGTPATRPVGEWNRARIRVQGDHIEHWLNGHKKADIERGSPEWNSAIADSKFSGVDGFGLARRGHITLQDHGDIVWFRNLKIRPLDDVPR